MTNQQHERGLMVYPAGGWRRLMFKAPLLLWRMGWKPLLGHRFVVLTTAGRKSGLPRHTMTEYSLVNGKVVVASGWGARTHWVKNIEADPLVTVQTAQATQRCRARRIDDEATLRLACEGMQRSPAYEPTLAIWGIDPPTIDALLANKDKAYFFILEPADVPAPPPLEEDLRWLTGLAAVALVLGFLMRRR